ncbi:uncharacterized protein LAESUDRAFT_421235 [Laetiporus sulphureus 93-53]|uniref:Uncharacterized protein n=1 Tax=Laetiporus sulphureus 93-53 TaxID=1314785 RepID=A0A165GGY7_9APHY|nr:uncharacterized protein LAESUDRAFT_421235 [Laetiporus sulphureus 93-53]KZT10331.1 hypothetical protein LAESUDRAFT_421235 [Laetiporus sulphureus 93-53]
MPPSRCSLHPHRTSWRVHIRSRRTYFQPRMRFSSIARGAQIIHHPSIAATLGISQTNCVLTAELPSAWSLTAELPITRSKRDSAHVPKGRGLRRCVAQRDTRITDSERNPQCGSPNDPAAVLPVIRRIRYGMSLGMFGQMIMLFLLDAVSCAL